MRRRAGKHKPYPFTEPAKLTPMQEFVFDKIRKMRRDALRRLADSTEVRAAAEAERLRRRARPHGSSS